MKSGATLDEVWRDPSAGFENPNLELNLFRELIVDLGDIPQPPVCDFIVFALQRRCRDRASCKIEELVVAPLGLRIGKGFDACECGVSFSPLLNEGRSASARGWGSAPGASSHFPRRGMCAAGGPLCCHGDGGPARQC